MAKKFESILFNPLSKKNKDAFKLNKEFVSEFDGLTLEDFFHWTDEPDPLDVKYQKNFKLKKEATEFFQHNCNGINSLYCRLVNCFDFLGKYEHFFSDTNKNRKIAKKLGKFYEKNFYNGNGGARLTRVVNYPSKLLKTLVSPFLDESCGFSRSNFKE
jgi:hypothetical protein